MKKILVLMLVVLLLFSAAACSGQDGNGRTEPEPSAAETTDTADEPVDGGWGESKSVEVGSEVKAMFDKLNETLAGAYYLPVAYLSSQVVAGTNHLVLCKEMPSYGNYDAVGTYVLVTVYEDLDGNAEITQVLYSGVNAPQPYNPDAPTAGGWSEPESCEVTEEARIAVMKAFETVDAFSYEPVALLGTQVVAGMNYLVLCKPVPSLSGDSDYVILTVYADLEGGAEKTDIAYFTADDGSSRYVEGDSASSQAE